MNRMLGIAVLALLAVGCATNSSVKDRIDPISARLADVEQKNAAMESKLADMNRKLDAQAGDLQAQHDPDQPEADVSHQPLEAGPPVGLGGRHDRQHADPHVERGLHLGVVDPPPALHQVEDRLRAPAGLSRTCRHR